VSICAWIYSHILLMFLYMFIIGTIPIIDIMKTTLGQGMMSFFFKSFGYLALICELSTIQWTYLMKFYVINHEHSKYKYQRWNKKTRDSSFDRKTKYLLFLSLIEKTKSWVMKLDMGFPINYKYTCWRPIFMHIIKWFPSLSYILVQPYKSHFKHNWFFWDIFTSFIN